MSVMSPCWCRRIDPHQVIVVVEVHMFLLHGHHGGLLLVVTPLLYLGRGTYAQESGRPMGHAGEGEGRKHGYYGSKLPLTRDGGGRREREKTNG